VNSGVFATSGSGPELQAKLYPDYTHKIPTELSSDYPQLALFDIQWPDAAVQYATFALSVSQAGLNTRNTLTIDFVSILWNLALGALHADLLILVLS
jgi:hypothetical protein